MGFDPSTATSAFDPSTAQLAHAGGPSGPLPKYADALDSLGNPIVPKSLYDPTNGNSFLQNLMAGIGGGMSRASDMANAGAVRHPILNKALGPLGPLLSNYLPGGDTTSPGAVATQQQLAAHTALDAPLRATGGGGLGYALPALAATAPLGGMGYAGAALAGGAQAALTGDNPVLGAAMGVGGRAVASGLGGIVSKLVNQSRGNIDPAVLAAQQTAGAVGGPVTVGDMYPGGAFSTAENLSKHFYGSGRRATMQAQTGALESGTNDLLSGMPGAGATATPEQTIIQSLKDELAARKVVAKGNYDALGAAVKATGDDTVPMTQTQTALGQLAGEFPGILNSAELPTSTKALVSKVLQPGGGQSLNAVDNGLLQMVGGAPDAAQLARFESASPGITDRFGQATSGQSVLSFDEARKLRSGMLQISRNQNIQSNPQLAAMVSNATGALHADQDVWMNALPNSGIKGLAENATNHYRTQVAPYQNSNLLSSLLQPGANSDSLLGRAAAGPQAAGELMSSMGPEGQQALAAGMLQKRIAPAVGDTLSAGASTARFRNMANVGPEVGQNRALDTVLDPDTAAKLAQLRNYSMLTDRSPGWAAPDNTGVKALPFAALAAVLAGHPGAVLPFAVAKLLNVATKSPGIQRFVGAQGLDPNSILPLLGGVGGSGLMDYLGH